MVDTILDTNSAVDNIANTTVLSTSMYHSTLFNTHPPPQQQTYSISFTSSPAIEVLNAHGHAQVLGERDDVQLLALLTHRLHLPPAGGRHVCVITVSHKGEEAVRVQAQVA